MTKRETIIRYIDRATNYDAATVIITRDRRVVAKLDPNKTLAAWPTDDNYYLVGSVAHVLEDAARYDRRTDDIYEELYA